MTATRVEQTRIISDNVRAAVDAALERSGGLLRLATCWVPRSFLQPGKRMKLDCGCRRRAGVSSLG